MIAEGIEKAEQQRLLTQADCDYGQGYLFAEPLTVAALESYVRQAASPPA